MTTSNRILLGVNIDHVATLRQARGTRYPDPVKAALDAEEAGADGITVHLREDRRHIQDEDVRRLRDLTQIKLNLEMAATDEMVGIACGLQPEMAMFVPEGRHEVTTELESGNWKSTADGYLDGYHIGYLHRDNIGLKAINNRNTWDLYGPHVRLGFANKPIVTMRDTPVDEWDLTEAMSLVHYVFPNVSISGQPNRLTMVSILLPTGVGTSKVVQYHYSREPIETADQRQAMETRRKLYAAVTGDEDFSTVMQINRAFPAMATDDFLFGRNESGNQNLHTWAAKLCGLPV